MSHPNQHAKSSAKKFGGKPEDYIHLHEWMDETKSWLGDSLHRLYRHHSEGINNYIPSAKEWLNNIMKNERPQWMLRTLKLDD